MNVGVVPQGALAAGALPPAVTTFPALIDTGASSTCISPVVAHTLGLRPIGMRPMTSATQLIAVNVYLVDLVLPFGNSGLVLPSVQVMEFAQAGGGLFQILVGRDVLCQGSLTMSFDGHFTFSI
jgi:hypothetical protein